MNYSLIHYGFRGPSYIPTLTLLPEGGDFVELAVRDISGTITADVSSRQCIGWHDLASTKSFPCPKNSSTNESFDQCKDCAQKTGFNPAFYHAQQVSPQQQARNQQPHLVYLAYFAPGIIKVGMSWAQRDLRRLLEQGARSTLVLGTFPTANEARAVEASLARLPGIAETIQVRHKIQQLSKDHSSTAAAQELHAAFDRAKQHIELRSQPQLHHLDDYYSSIPISRPIDLTKQQKISGKCIGMIGSLLLFEKDQQQYVLSLSKLKGYTLHISDVQTDNQHDPVQVSLF